ncbi:hypothetical protein BB560_005456 [Smittium megazygosporum]|uniref:Elongation factor 1-gamma n=1 Tax=Smittium megazygosporum TaxID=133381 RepID=A0A2T9Z5B6_9FUNG|nr:hypothetical protein BB560_005456 [Smittium megazygosporum]
MTHLGKIYAPTWSSNFRLAKQLIVKNLAGVDFETTPDFSLDDIKSPEYLSIFPTGKVPGLVNGDFKLFDSSAILFYLASKGNNPSILGSTPEESALILQFMFFSEAELMPAYAGFFYPTAGYEPYAKPAVQASEQRLVRFLTSLNNILLDRTYLVGDRVTIADVNMVCDLRPIFSSFMDTAARKQFRNVTRYFTTMIGKKDFKPALADFEFISEKVKVQQKPKEEKKKNKEQPKPAKKETAAPAKAEEAPAPKPKSALDLLPKSSFDLESWKRFYSNNDTIPTAMDYFWQHFDPEGYSIWKVDYKYNSELTKIFMTCNLVGGFFARLERARKYAFGVLLVLGENDNNSISGYFVIRGQTVPEEVYDAADYPSYDFTKVDHNDPAVRSAVADFFAWEGPSLPKPFADGKVFK